MCQVQYKPRRPTLMNRARTIITFMALEQERAILQKQLFNLNGNVCLEGKQQKK